jgi:pimeloyl-ACP methyl ester carboxylesterase
MQLMQSSFQYKNATISYRKEGGGKTIILLHGFGEDSSIWDEQVAVLKDVCKVIVPDLPGIAWSESLQPSSEGTPVSIDDFADVIYALAHHENLTAFTLLGHSMGGYITVAFAKKYAHLLNGFGLLHSTTFADNDEKKANRAKGMEMMKQYGGYAFLKNTTPNLFSDEYKKKEPGKVASLIEGGKEYSTDTLIQFYEAMMNRPDRTEVLKNSKVPVLFIIGSVDVAAPLNDLLQQVHLPSVSYIHVLEGVGHIGMWEATDEFNQHLLQFINDVSETQ